jgi:outer membrane lipoprotein-sorting protein
MKALFLAAALAFGATVVTPAFAQPHAAVLDDAQMATLKRVEAYLNGLHALKAKFLQIAQDGRTSSGTAWLVRPGKLRFAYDPPSPLLLVASHGLVVFRDNALDQTTNIPEGQTPLGLLLRDNVTLSGDVTVVGMETPPGQIQMTLVKTASPGDGSLTLVFNDNPLTLTGWTVIDAEGRETRIRLSDIQLGGHFDNSLFTFIDPHFFNPNGNTP